jgi:hypothetical protein
MGLKGKYLHTTTLKNYSNPDTRLAVYGVFNTKNVNWTYFVISYRCNVNGGEVKLTEDVCSRYEGDPTISSIVSLGKKVGDLQEGIAFIKDFTTKWESGSNNTKSEIRKEKLDNLLSDEEKDDE